MLFWVVYVSPMVVSYEHMGTIQPQTAKLADGCLLPSLHMAMAITMVPGVAVALLYAAILDVSLRPLRNTKLEFGVCFICA